MEHPPAGVAVPKTGAPPSTLHHTPPGSVRFDEIPLQDMPTSIRVCEQQIRMNGWMLGGMLQSVKARLPHGQFMPWVQTHTDLSQSTANELMSLYEGVQQTPFLGELNQSAAIALLALEPAQREQFAADHDVRHMSVRTLKAKIEAGAATVAAQSARVPALTRALEMAEQERQSALAAKDAEARNAQEQARQARAEAEHTGELYEALLTRHNEAQERIIRLEQALAEEPVATLTPVEVEKIVEVTPPDYGALKTELREATAYAERMEQKARDAQAELLRRTPAGEDGGGTEGLRHAAMQFLARAALTAGRGTNLQLMPAKDREVLRLCIDAVGDWCREARAALDGAAAVLPGYAQVE
jgi:hypothetical protein